MAWPGAVILCLLGVLVWALIAHALLVNPRGDAETGLLWYFGRAYARVVHRLRIEGAEHIPRNLHPGPMVVVANHTAGVDPILVQAACPFEIRWLMADDMRAKVLDPFWQWAGVIPVASEGKSLRGVREALAHLGRGGVIGVFPEGGLERPPRTILPFLGGVGVIIHRSRAPVLPVIIEGTPQVHPAWGSLWRFSRSRVRVMAPIDYAASGLAPHPIAEDLRRRFIAWTGWPANDSPQQPAPGKNGGK